MLASTIKCFQLSGFPLTIGRVCQLAFQYASVNGITGFSDERQMAGHKWLSGFLKCHPDISLKKARNLSIARAMGTNPERSQNTILLVSTQAVYKVLHSTVWEQHY